MIKTIPSQICNEGSAFEFDLKTFALVPGTEPLQFRAVLADGKSLETLGLVCSADGLIKGVLLDHVARESPYKVIVVASTASSEPLIAYFNIVVKEAHEVAVDAQEVLVSTPDAVNINPFTINLDEPMEAPIAPEGLNLPTAADIAERAVTRADLYYLLGRYATLTIWNADVLEPASQLNIIQLEGASENFYVFDRGSSLVAAPKDLFASGNTLLHAIKTAQAMMRELHSRGWTVEAAGYDRMVKAAWIEGRRLSEVTGKEIKFLHYNPSQQTKDYYTVYVQPRAANLGAGYVA